MNRCLLCHNSNVKFVEKIQVSDIKILYKKYFNIDTSLEFQKHEWIIFSQCNACGLFFFDPSVSGSESFYNQIQAFDWYNLDEKCEFEIAKKYINDGDSVLEIGCGKGAFARKINTNNYVGLEFNEKSIEKARKNGYVVLKQSVQDFSLTNKEKFDVVCYFQVLEHVNDPSTFIQCSIDSLKKGGTLIISVPNMSSFLSRITNFALNMPPHHLTCWTEESLTNIINFYALKLKSLERTNLEEIHINDYFKTLAILNIKKFFKIDFRYVDLSLKHRIINFCGLILSKLMKRSLNKNLPLGHTVIAIYIKR